MTKLTIFIAGVALVFMPSLLHAKTCATNSSELETNRQLGLRELSMVSALQGEQSLFAWSDTEGHFKIDKIQLPLQLVQQGPGAGLQLNVIHQIVNDKLSGKKFKICKDESAQNRYEIVIIESDGTSLEPLTFKFTEAGEDSPRTIQIGKLPGEYQGYLDALGAKLILDETLAPMSEQQRAVAGRGIDNG